MCGGKICQLAMKILFLCGSLEPGQDGVGDYTRRLAGEIIRQGHESLIIAINDYEVSEVLCADDFDLKQVIKTLRIPIFLSWKKRIELIQIWIQEQNPDWISLQYVPFAFQNKGLPFLLAGQLKKISQGRKWHIMFHELWVRDKALKFRVLGALQKIIAERMIHKINASVIHTHLPLYHSDLTKFSNTVRKLPLFSNFIKPSVPMNPDKRVLRVGFFNLVGEGPKITTFLIELYRKSVQKRLEFEIVMIGGATESLKSFGNQLETFQEFKNKIKYTGFLTNDMISEVISTCNVGITPMNMSSIGKSGTCAAFLSQGIPLAIPVVDDKDQPFFDRTLIKALLFEPDLDKLRVAGNAARNARNSISLDHITTMFLKDLMLACK